MNKEKIYQCPMCGSVNVQAGNEIIPNTYAAKVFARCNDCRYGGFDIWQKR